MTTIKPLNLPTMKPVKSKKLTTAQLRAIRARLQAEEVYYILEKQIKINQD